MLYSLETYHLWAPSTAVAGWLRHCRYGKLWLSDRPSAPEGACSAQTSGGSTGFMSGGQRELKNEHWMLGFQGLLHRLGFAYIQAIKQVIVRLLVLHKQLKILKHLQEAEQAWIQTQRRHILSQNKTALTYPLLHRDFVVVADGVFTQEVKLHHILLAIVLWIELDVFNSQRAAAHGVGSLSFLLLITRSQSQLEHIRTAGLKRAYKEVPLTVARGRAPAAIWAVAVVAIHLTLSIK